MADVLKVEKRPIEELTSTDFDFSSAQDITEREDKTITFDNGFDFNSAKDIDDIDQVHPDVPSPGAYLNFKFRKGFLPLVRGAYGREGMWGKITPEEALSGGNKAYLEQLDKAGQLRDISFKEAPVRAALGEAAELLPLMLTALQEGAKTGVAIGGGFAILTALAGQAGPQVLTPEELVTVPVAFAAGMKTGMGFGIIKTSMDIEGGNLFLDLIESGISVETARPLALSAGFAIGLVELAELNVLAAPFKKLFAKTVASGVSKSAMIEMAKLYFKTIGVEVAQEELQEIIGLTTEMVAGMAENKPDTIPTREEWSDRMKDVAVKTALGISVLGFPGALASGVSINIQNKNLSKEQKRTVVRDLFNEKLEKQKLPDPDQVTGAKVVQPEPDLTKVQDITPTPEVGPIRQVEPEILSPEIVAEIKDTQVIGRLAKLDTDIVNVQQQINDLSIEERKLVRAGAPTRAINNKIVSLIQKENDLLFEKGTLQVQAKEQISLDKETIELKAKKLQSIEAAALREKVQAFERGEEVTRENITSIQARFNNLLDESDLSREDKDKFRRTLEGILDTKDPVAAFNKKRAELDQRIAVLEDKAARREAVLDLKKLAKAEVAADFQEQIDNILENIELKTPTEKTKAKRRAGIADFLAAQREAGALDFIPPDFFTGISKVPLNKLDTQQLLNIRDQITVLVHQGRNANKLFQMEGQKNVDERAEQVADTIYERTGVTESEVGEVQPLVPGPKKNFIGRARESFDGWYGDHRKVEGITADLHVSDTIFKPIQRGVNAELTRSEKTMTKIQEAFELIAKDIKNTMDKQVKIAGVNMTRENMITVALNAGNTGNFTRLTKGNKFTLPQIQEIISKLEPNEVEFVDRVFTIIDELFPDTVIVIKQLTGLQVRKVAGKYFPIIVDRELNKRAKFQAAAQDLFQEIFQVTYVNQSFTKSRKGGVAPIDLNGFSVILKHVDAVNHFNSMAVPVRDAQKIINHPKTQKAFFETVGEAEYNQLIPWLRDIANPRRNQSGTHFDKLAQFLRHNSTAAILGTKVVTSLLQVGSITQTINRIGMKNTMIGMRDFIKNPKRAIEFVYSLDPEMKNRSKRLDRDMRDWLQTKQAKRIIQGRASYRDVLFSFIRGVDFVTVMPTWLGSYHKSYTETKNQDVAADFAAEIVRRTQPTGAVQNLAQVMRGPESQRLFTMFMSHFTNMHNEMVSAKNELKYSKNHPMGKISNYARSMFWLWVAPAVFATFVRSGGNSDDYKKFLDELIMYPFSGMVLIRDLVNSIVKGFDFGAPPGLAAGKEIALTFTSSEGRTKLKHGVKAVGLLTGRVPTQWVDSVEGFIDLMNEETDDFRRIIWSAFQLDSDESDSGFIGSRGIRK